MTWRGLLYDRLAGHAPLVALIPVESMYGAGSMDRVPSDPPFLVIRSGDETPVDGLRTVATQGDAEVWVHDIPGSYVKIDSILREVRSALESPVAEPWGIDVEWQGDGPELADDLYGTILRVGSYRLTGRR